MTQDPNTPEPEHLPAAHRGPAPSNALQLRGNHALGMPLPAQAATPDDDDDVLDLRDLWRMVVKHKGLLLSVAIAGLLVAVLLSFIKTPLYLATTSVQVDKRAARVVQFGQDADATQDMDDRTALGTQVELLKSRVLAERVIDELRLDRQGLPMPTAPAAEGDAPALADGEADPAEATGWKAMAGNLMDRIKDSYGKIREPSSNSVERLNREGVINAFQSTVKVEQVRNSRMLRIQVENASPQLAARIANSVTDTFIALNLERRMDSSSYAKTFLETQLGLTKARLEESERKLNEYARSKNILTLDEKTNVLNQTFTEYSTALTKAEQEVIKTESDYEAIKTAPNTARQVLESVTIQNYKDQLSKLDQTYQEAAKVFKEDFPRMKQLRAQMDELQGKIQAEVQSILASVRNQAQTAKRQENLIRTRLQQTRAEIMSAQDRSVDFNLLKREVDTNRELYNGLLQQVKEVGVAGGVEANNIQVVDKAEVPLFPYKPRLALNAAIGLLAGIVLGLGIVFLMESMDDSIKFADEVEKFLQVPLLGVIPKIRDKKMGSGSLAMLVHEDPRGQMAEAYRSVRTALQFSTADGAPRRLVLTSTTKSEGKSTTALALAINFAQMGSKVVLIDADMRNPTVHKYLNLPNTAGLSNYLSGHGKPGEITRMSAIDNLMVITAGPIPPSPVDLLTGARLGELMDLLEVRGAQYIIFDGPPVLGLADAIVLGNQVHSVLFVAQASQTRKSHIKDAFRRLRMAGVVPCGVVLTKTTAQNTAYYTYDNYYGYGVDSPKDGPTAAGAGTGVRTEPSLTAT
ncbi:MAG: polysaccharide biosynthesis tyrosine autokinase [Simplicispira suum]|uniref:GumC family protein n=1 Tax=Simplicispira suum TaxID=2109915 RepID=UPI001C6ABB81|nr:polysaccharide biosynthesis tyrosine autokinase [Simplicispira suum]MBW7832206.1 polysaccharide biosynthesis tyrosine autokinase [Simplicispira suum]